MARTRKLTVLNASAGLHRERLSPVAQDGRRLPFVGRCALGGEGPTEAAAGAKQERMGLKKTQFVSDQWIPSCKSLGRPLVYHL